MLNKSLLLTAYRLRSCVTSAFGRGVDCRSSLMPRLPQLTARELIAQLR
jgi:hypothetical protein